MDRQTDDTDNRGFLCKVQKPQTSKLFSIENHILCYENRIGFIYYV